MIQRGHTLHDIRGYTLMQLRVFSEAAERARRRDMADDVINLRVAQFSDKNDFKTYMKALTDG